MEGIGVRVPLLASPSAAIASVDERYDSIAGCGL
jgi:hypothetical protein